MLAKNHQSNTLFRRLEQADRFFGAEVGQEANGAAGIKSGALNFFDAHIAAEIPEIKNREEVQVVRPVPRQRQGLGNRCASVEQHLEANANIGKIRVGDNHMPANAECFPDNVGRRNQFLKSAEQQDVVEGMLAVLIQAVGDVALVDDEAAFDATDDQRGVLFNAFPGDLPGLNEALEKRAVASAKIEDAGALRDPVDNCVVNARMHG